MEEGKRASANVLRCGLLAETRGVKTYVSWVLLHPMSLLDGAGAPFRGVDLSLLTVVLLLVPICCEDQLILLLVACLCGQYVSVPVQSGSDP